MKLETWFGALMVFTGIVIMLIALTLGIVIPASNLPDLTGNTILDGIFLTPPFFEAGGLVLILLGKMHSQNEERRTLTRQ